MSITGPSGDNVKKPTTSALTAKNNAKLPNVDESLNSNLLGLNKSTSGASGANGPQKAAATMESDYQAALAHFKSRQVAIDWVRTAWNYPLYNHN